MAYISTRLYMFKGPFNHIKEKPSTPNICLKEIVSGIVMPEYEKSIFKLLSKEDLFNETGP